MTAFWASWITLFCHLYCSSTVLFWLVILLVDTYIDVNHAVKHSDWATLNDCMTSSRSALHADWLKPAEPVMSSNNLSPTNRPPVTSSENFLHSDSPQQAVPVTSRHALQAPDEPMTSSRTTQLADWSPMTSPVGHVTEMSNKFYKTPLMTAALGGQADMVRYLVENGWKTSHIGAIWCVHIEPI